MELGVILIGCIFITMSPDSFLAMESNICKLISTSSSVAGTKTALLSLLCASALEEGVLTASCVMAGPQRVAQLIISE